MSLDPALRARLAELGAHISALATSREPVDTDQPVWATLSAYGDVSSPQGAEAAFNAAIADLTARGGGMLLVPGDTSPTFRPHLSTDGVSLVDARAGQMRVLVGERARCWSKVSGAPEGSVVLEGTLSEPRYRYGSQSPLAVQQVNVHGGNSARCRLLEDVAPGPAARWYPNDPESIYVGQELYSEGAGDWIRVSGLGWDAASRRMYFEADCPAPAAAGTVIGHKSDLGALALHVRDQCRNQGHGVSVTKRHYADGDTFPYVGLLYYQGNIASCEGDEGGHVFAADIFHDLQNFRATVDRWEPETRALWFKDARRGYALAEGRPLINLNPARHLTQGRVRVYISYTYDQLVNHQPDGQTPVGGPNGVVLGVGTSWGPEIVGRYLAIDDPSEMLDPATLPSHVVIQADAPLYRWMRIIHFAIDPNNGNQLLWIQHCNGGSFPAAPRLVHNKNYFNYGGPELAYRIAPGASVADLRGGWTEDGHPNQGFVLLTPGSDETSAQSWQPGDPIEQAIGPQPHNPTAFRARHFNNLPSIFTDSSFYSSNHGSVTVGAGLFINGHDTLAASAARFPRGGVDYEHAVLIRATTESSICIHGEARTGNALQLEQVAGDRKWIAWGSSTDYARIGYDPREDAFNFARRDGGGFSVHFGGAQLRRVAGISATSTPTGNLRGILVPVPAGATELEVSLPMPEPDRAYAVTVTPSWPVAVGVSARGTAGFTVCFGGAAPDGATLDWVLVR